MKKACFGRFSNGPRKQDLRVPRFFSRLSESEKKIALILKYFRIQHPLADNSEILRAYIFAEQKHARQIRRSGDEFIDHPREIAEEAARRGYESRVIQGCLLHDTIEDTNTTYFEIRDVFGAEVARIVDLLTKPKLIEGKWVFASQQEYYLRKDEYVAAIHYEKRAEIYYGRLFRSGCIDAIVAKLFDCVHNLKTIEHLSDGKRHRNVRTMIKHMLHLSTRLLHPQHSYEVLLELERWGFGPHNVAPEGGVVVLPPRRRLADMLPVLPAAQSGAVTVYLKPGEPHFEIGIPQSVRMDSSEVGMLLERVFSRHVREVGSILAPGMGGAERMFNLNGGPIELSVALSGAVSFYHEILELTE